MAKRVSHRWPKRFYRAPKRIEPLAALNGLSAQRPDPDRVQTGLYALGSSHADVATCPLLQMPIANLQRSK
jgi:hypothetical protein